MPRLVLRDELLDAQVLRAIGTAPYGGADIGECLAAARSIDESDLASWYEVWRGLGERVAGTAERAEAAGQFESARLAFLRASTYHRTAGVMLMGPGPDARLVASNARQSELFRRAMALMETPAEVLAIPFEGHTLPGYFLRAASNQAARPTVVLTGGYDGTAEELYFWNGSAALARGYNVLAFDGPGQGAALLQSGLRLRPDWETVIGAVLDHALARVDVDATRVALIGLSLGAHLAPRAASAERRLAACICDCGAFDLYGAAIERIPGPLASGYQRGNRAMTSLLVKLLDRLSRKPTAGWALRRGMLVHGAASPLGYIDSLRPYTLAGRAELITCPTWVCSAQDDDISRSARRLVDALTCTHDYVAFATADGAGDHCEAAARTLYHTRSFEWLDHLLNPHSPHPNDANGRAGEPIDHTVERGSRAAGAG
jgi:alpha-beta hydrolase superfamily lysophospholipase